MNKSKIEIPIFFSTDDNSHKLILCIHHKNHKSPVHPDWHLILLLLRALLHLKPGSRRRLSVNLFSSYLFSVLLFRFLHPVFHCPGYKFSQISGYYYSPFLPLSQVNITIQIDKFKKTRYTESCAAGELAVPCTCNPLQQG